MDSYRNQQSMCEKINSSIKKSHKISIYSRKTNNNNNRSPNKKYNNIDPSLLQQQQNMNYIQHSGQLTSTKTQYQKVNNIINNEQVQIQQRSLSQYNNNMNYVQSKNDNVKPNIMLKHQPLSYQQKHQPLSYQQNHLQNDFFNQSPLIVKKTNTFTHNTIQNVNNISQMIDKQAQSQINNLSILQGSFMTGNRNKITKQSQYSLTNNMINIPTNNNMNNISTNSNVNTTQNLQHQQTMDSFMKFIHQQISIVKQNYQQKFNLLIKNNVHIIKQLQSRLYQNHLLLKQKIVEIERLKEVLKRNNGNNNNNVINNSNKRISSEGEITNGKDQRNGSISQGVQGKKLNTHNNNNNSSYYEKRIADLQSKLRILQSSITQNPQQKQTTIKLEKKIQLLQKGLINYFSSKIANISTNLLQPFISTYSNKISTLYQSIQSISHSLLNFRQESVKISFNQNKIKQLFNKMKQIEKEFKQFVLKQFKYENYGVYEFQQKLKKMKLEIKEFQLQQVGNSKLMRQLMQQIAIMRNNGVITMKQQQLEKNQFYLQKKKLVNLNNAQQTMSKYSRSVINNTSKNSISQLSNTHQYSHLIQKLNPRQYSNTNEQNNINRRNLNNNNNNNATSSQSFIQLNFTLQQGQQQLNGIGLQGSLKVERKDNCSKIDANNKGQSGIVMSKYTMRTVNNQLILKSQTSNNNTNKNNNNNSSLKQTTTTNTYNNVSPSLISKLSLPNTRPSISIQSILSPPHLSSTQQKIRNLSQLKMQSKQHKLQSRQQKLQSKQRLSSISSLSQQFFQQQQQTPRSPLQNHNQQYYKNIKNEQIQSSSSLVQNNTSYLSIGQLQDYHQSLQYQHLLQLQGNNNNTSCDWSDDEFFYPQLMQKQYQQESNVQNYCWDKSQPLSSREELSSPNNIKNNKNYHLYTLPKAKLNTNNINSNKFITQQNDQFSPMKKKPISTQTNFYQSMKYDNTNHNNNNNSEQSSPVSYQKLTKTKSNQESQYPQKKLIYSGTFDYQKFSDSDQEKDNNIRSKNGSPMMIKSKTINSNEENKVQYNNKLPPQQQQSLSKNQQIFPYAQQSFTINEQKLIQRIKILQKSQLPIKFIYDRKKSQGIAKMPNPAHQLNGKSFSLDRKQLQKLQKLGFIQVKTYI